MERRAAIFDINETVLDLHALDPLFAAWFGDAGARREWFRQTLHFAMTLAATRAYVPFDRVAAAALTDLASRRQVSLPVDALAELRQQTARLPPHADVAPALARLREADVAIAAMSNNPLPLLREQLRNAGLVDTFSQIMSVAEAGALKPAPEVYGYAVNRLGLPAASCWMIAAHGWDIAGAARAGLRGAFVARPGQVADPFALPEIVAGDLVSLVAAIVTAT